MYFGTSGGLPNPYLRAESLPELLSWHDVDFVRCAYVTVLGRQPDPRGETHYTFRIRSGVSKLEILRQMRRSKEGSDHDPGIAGFDRTLERSKLERSSILGPVVRLFTKGEGDSAAWRRHRSLLNEIGRLGAQHESSALIGVVDAVAGLERGVTALVNRLSMQAYNPHDPEMREGGEAVAEKASRELLNSPAYRQISPTTQRLFRKLVIAK